MSAPSRLAPKLCRFCRASPAALRRTFASATATEAQPQQWPQRQPRGEYYDILLRDPTPYATTKAEKPPSSAQTTPAETKPAAAAASTSSPARTYETISSRTAYSDSNGGETTAAERARVIFGSRLLGPAERADRAAARQAQATTIAGVRVPPRPEEPDNCCMSGCVNCVWDLYREDMEEWTLKANEAKRRLAAESAAAGVAGVAGAGQQRPPPPPPPPGAGGGGVGGGVGRGGDPLSPAEVSSMDADGGGSETNWSPAAVGGDAKIAKDMWTDDLFQNVPVGIREFMKQEKRLKEKHLREGTSGG